MNFDLKKKGNCEKAINFEIFVAFPENLNFNTMCWVKI